MSDWDRIYEWNVKTVFPKSNMSLAEMLALYETRLTTLKQMGALDGMRKSDAKNG